jgi:hypothetical protein
VPGTLTVDASHDEATGLVGIGIVLQRRLGVRPLQGENASLVAGQGRRRQIHLLLSGGEVLLVNG